MTAEPRAVKRMKRFAASRRAASPPGRGGNGASAVALSALFYTVFALIFTFPLVAHLGSGILRGLDTEDAFR